MSTFRLQIVKLAALLCLAAAIGVGIRPTTAAASEPAGQNAMASADSVDAVPTAPVSPAATASPNIPDSDTEDDEWSSRDHRGGRHHRSHRNHDGDVFNFGNDSVLRAGEHADSVVSIFGSAISEGDAAEAVSVFGNTHATGPVSGDAVSVFGSTYVDSKVDGDAVAVFGNLELGPHAEIGGDVVTVFGKVQRDPAAIVHGGVNNVFATSFGDMQGLHGWIRHCLLYGRPLAIAPGLGWAWTVAGGFLAFYIILALMFRGAVSECVSTVETQPGRTAAAALLATLFTPVLLVLLFVTVIGIAAVPFVLAAVFCAALFGKAVMLAWLGHRIVGARRSLAAPGDGISSAMGHPALAVLVGGVLVTVLYLVPLLGFLFYKLLGIFGFGAVVYTLILHVRAHQATRTDRPRPVSPGPAPGPSPDFATPFAAAAAAGPAPSSEQAPPLSSTNSRAYMGATAALPRAGFWIRIGALFLDLLLIGFVTSLWHPFREIHLVVLATYGALMWKLRGTTVGGIVFDLQVVRLDGREVDWETSIVRALGCFLSLFVVGLGFIWIAFDKDNQAWHDKIAGTVVVRVPKSPPLL